MKKQAGVSEKDRYRGGLCFRCDHRANYHETKQQPRYECGTEMAVHSCYMYKPTTPLVLVPSDRTDKRPFLGPAFIASRACAVGKAEGKWHAMAQGQGVVVYFKPAAARKSDRRAHASRKSNKK